MREKPLERFGLSFTGWKPVVLDQLYESDKIRISLSRSSKYVFVKIPVIQIQSQKKKPKVS